VSGAAGVRYGRRVEETTVPDGLRFVAVSLDCADPAELAASYPVDPAGHPFCITTLAPPPG
jgi:hypothetical protein